jgi:hypothetical protein
VNGEVFSYKEDFLGIVHEPELKDEKGDLRVNDVGS